MQKSQYEIMKFAGSHYENFPVISFIVPKEYRTDIAALYWFARTADDLSDEGDMKPGERIQLLEQFEERFNNTLNCKFYGAPDEILYNTIKGRDLTPSLFTDLISAFKQDVVKTRYKTFDELLDYCRRSANPVGRLMLQIFNIRYEETYMYSDKICTALQLTNFYQDVSADFKRGRIYFPQDEMEHFGTDEWTFEINEINDKLKSLVQFSIERTEDLFNEGKKLLPFLKGRIRIEIEWTIRGGMKILRKIRKNDYNVFKRPLLNFSDFTGILIKSFF